MPDRYGDVVEDEGVNTADPLRHDPRCCGGWVGEDNDGRPVPCPTCRPNLGRRTAATWHTARPATASTRADAMQTIRAELARARRGRTGQQP